MSELKPCPFCGGDANAIPSEHSDDCYFMVMRNVKLNKDSADCSFVFDAIEAWNRRALPAQAGQVLTRHEQEDLYRETSNRVAQLEAENRYEFASWFFIAVELVEQAVRAKLGAGVPMTDPQLQTSEERRATGDRILELIEKQHPGIVGEKGGA